MMLMRSYMTHGHMIADLDPLQLKETYKNVPSYAMKLKLPEQSILDMINYKFYGFTEQDLEREFNIDAQLYGGLMTTKRTWKLKDLIAAYHNAYCKKIGVEFMHISNIEQQNWIRDKFEKMQYEELSKEKKMLSFDRLVWADEFGNFLENKFNTMKRFGLEGCESFIPGIKELLDALVENGAEKVVIGMPHRGRLNVLANVVRKPLEQIFNEFQGIFPTDLDVEDNL
jgi:2-oxoglutarate dehydrogenase E1 component